MRAAKITQPCLTESHKIALPRAPDFLENRLHSEVGSIDCRLRVLIVGRIDDANKTARKNRTGSRRLRWSKGATRMDIRDILFFIPVICAILSPRVADHNLLLTEEVYYDGNRKY
mmetsp:Transcript_34085/g.38119  ORF Transcript_34085/g.38119 Transcript_34085/m.38119 type:complete len:115 (+) Transcript_34085:2361-2705(+)